MTTRRKVLTGGGIAAIAAASVATLGGDGIIDQTSLEIKGVVSVSAFGADPTGIRESSDAFEQAIKDSSCVYVPPGRYLLTRSVSVPSRVHIFSSNPETAILVLGSSDCPIVLKGSGSQISGLTIDGDYQSQTCLVLDEDSSRCRVTRCRILKGQKVNVAVGKGATNFTITGSEIRKAGSRNGDKIHSPGALGMHCQGNGWIYDTNIGSTTGACLLVSGFAKGEEVRLNVIGGRLNFGYEGLAIVDGSVGRKRTTLHCQGTYFENPGQLQDKGGVVNHKQEFSVLATGQEAYVSIQQAQKFQIRKVKYGIKARGGGHVDFDGNMPVMTTRSKKPVSTLFKTDTDETGACGTIRFGLPNLVEFPQQFRAFADAAPCRNRQSIVPYQANRILRVSAGKLGEKSEESISPLVMKNLDLEKVKFGASTGLGFRRINRSTGGEIILDWHPLGLKGRWAMVDFWFVATKAHNHRAANLFVRNGSERYAKQKSGERQVLDVDELDSFCLQSFLKINDFASHLSFRLKIKDESSLRNSVLTGVEISTFDGGGSPVFFG